MTDLIPIGTALQDSLQTYKLNEIITDVNALRRTGWTIEDSFTDFSTQSGSPVSPSAQISIYRSTIYPY